MIAVPEKMARRFQETRTVPVDPKRNTRHIVELWREDRLLRLLTEKLTLEKVEKKQSTTRKDMLNPCHPVDLMVGCLTWVLFVYDHELDFYCRSGSTNWCLPPILNEKKIKTLWAVHHHLVRQAGYLLPALRSVLCLRLNLMLYPPQVVNISESKHDALKKGCNQEKAIGKKRRCWDHGSQDFFL